MGKINSKQKGKAGELELSKVLKDAGFEARRSQQYCGVAGDSDVIGVPGYHIECKRVEKLNIENAMKQASSDAKEGEIPVVCHRKNRCDWLVTMRVVDWLKLIK